MELDEVIYLLMSSSREELRDHAFGDAEVYWSRNGKAIAVGYFGSTSGVSVTFEGQTTSFLDKDADRLRYLGTLAKVERNDETGPDQYQEGNCMPGLTLAGVFKEITK